MVNLPQGILGEDDLAFYSFLRLAAPYGHCVIFVQINARKKEAAPSKLATNSSRMREAL